MKMHNRCMRGFSDEIEDLAHAQAFGCAGEEVIWMDGLDQDDNIIAESKCGKSIGGPLSKENVYASTPDARRSR